MIEIAALILGIDRCASGFEPIRRAIDVDWLHPFAMQGVEHEFAALVELVGPGFEPRVGPVAGLDGDLWAISFGRP